MLTKLWGWERVVYAIVTQPKSDGDSHRLILCIKAPEDIGLDYAVCTNESICGYGKENIQFFPPTCYMLRWNMEISYYENKTFWSLEECRVRSSEGIEQMINLQAVSYSAMILLPYTYETFSCCQSASAQETRFGIGQQIQAGIIFSSFVEYLETTKKAQSFIKIIEGYV